jgi:hypothetical protein
MWVNGVLTPLSQHSATALVLPDLMMRLSKVALEFQDAEHLKSELADVEVSDDELRMIGRMVSDLEGSSVEALSTSATLEDLKAHLSPENFARIMKEVESSRRRRGRAFPKGWNEGV